MRIPIRTQREILRLHYLNRPSFRRTADVVGVSAGTVRTLVRRAESLEISWNELQALDDVAWCQILESSDKTRVRRCAPDWTWVNTELAQRDVTLDLLWREWRLNNPEGCAYSQFTAGYREWLRRQSLTMRQTHRPGDKLFVDFAGRTVEIFEADQPPRKAQIFVAVLGASSLTFAYAVWTQSIEDWIEAHVRAFEFFGGVPAWVVPDNLKAAVLRNRRDDLTINPSYAECLRHYNTAPWPARVRRPRDKSKAEVGVQIIQRLLARFRHRRFLSLDELNQALAGLVVWLNDKPLRLADGSRRSRFNELDMPALRALPPQPYSFSVWQYKVRVASDYHLLHEGVFYSTPFVHANHEVDLRVGRGVVEIYAANVRVATHRRSRVRGSVVTDPAHLPIGHLRQLESEPTALLEWSESLGAATHAAVLWHLTIRTDRGNGLRAAQRLRKLAREHGTQRIEEVCSYAQRIGSFALRSLESILRNGSDRCSQDSATSNSVGVGHHENIRGADYFGEPT
ncbi:IS21 family transposase [Niveibacterium sp. SC-1]|uniref:IS21 family transposase n=1 Tax=Niveibacterium sp. SC-1 TaxID=3135646 RepID=UPI00311E49D6